MNQKCDKCGVVTDCPFVLEKPERFPGVLGVMFKLCGKCGTEIVALINDKKEEKED